MSNSPRRYYEESTQPRPEEGTARRVLNQLKEDISTVKEKASDTLTSMKEKVTGIFGSTPEEGRFIEPVPTEPHTEVTREGLARVPIVEVQPEVPGVEVPIKEYPRETQFEKIDTTVADTSVTNSSVADTVRGIAQKAVEKVDVALEGLKGLAGEKEKAVQEAVDLQAQKAARELEIRERVKESEMQRLNEEKENLKLKEAAILEEQNRVEQNKVGFSGVPVGYEGPPPTAVEAKTDIEQKAMGLAASVMRDVETMGAKEAEARDREAAARMALEKAKQDAIDKENILNATRQQLAETQKEHDQGVDTLTRAAETVKEFVAGTEEKIDDIASAATGTLFEKYSQPMEKESSEVLKQKGTQPLTMEGSR